jgi:NAD(P)-dependent dehydrogenase (short-subunit alcohol dehydrogenase family)
MTLLFGKTILVTGTASGIGQRTAELASQLGADVFGIDLHQPDHPAGPLIQADISTPGGVKALVDQLPERIDALCNVAGVSGNKGAAPTLAINYFGLRALTEAMAPRIREGGAVVNVASIAGFGWRTNLERAKAIVDLDGFPDIEKVIADNDIKNEEGYPLSKELLLVWTMRAAHADLFKSRSIRVNAVSPGPVETPILAQFRHVLGNERVNSDIARTGRAGTSSDIAPVIAFLCSDGARWINGINLPVDGGLEASVNAEALGF